MRSTLDVALSRTRDSQEYRESLQTCQLITRQTQQIVNALLEMARLESGQRTAEFELVDIGLAIQRAAGPVRAQAEERQIVITRDHRTDILLKTDAGLLNLLLTNLLDNAITYVDDAGWISIDADATSDGLLVEIANSGCQLTTEQQSRVLERFWRADASRTETGRHAGLGLSLCQRIVDLLRATIEIGVADRVFTARVGFSPECVEISPSQEQPTEADDVRACSATEVVSTVE